MYIFFLIKGKTWKMVTTKHCAFGTCRSDSRYNDRPHMEGVVFCRFPSKLKMRDKCLKWVKACRRLNFTIDNINKHTYFCSKHFVGGKSPTELKPDPIPATSSDYAVSKFYSTKVFKCILAICLRFDLVQMLLAEKDC